MTPVQTAPEGAADYQDDLARRLSGDSTSRAFVFAALILAFSIWDHFVDADHAMAALWWRIATACAILLVQGLWVVSKRKSYTLYRRLVLTHTVTVPLGMTTYTLPGLALSRWKLPRSSRSTTRSAANSSTLTALLGPMMTVVRSSRVNFTPEPGPLAMRLPSTTGCPRRLSCPTTRGAALVTAAAWCRPKLS